MDYARNDENVPERVDRPTVFSTRTKTPIAVANNVWESLNDNLVDRTCLENGWTRFRLDGDRWVSLRLNWDAEKAWLSQAWRVFHARGVLLEDDLKDFTLVFPYVWLGGDLDESPSKCQLRRRQPIFLFIYPPHPNLLYGKTSSTHHWSFHEDGQPQISPELCWDLGLPIQLDFDDWGLKSHSWSTSNYQLIHQYQLLRGFDPTTTDFARHLGYNKNIFQPLNDDDRFREVDKGTPKLLLCFHSLTSVKIEALVHPKSALTPAHPSLVLTQKAHRTRQTQYLPVVSSILGTTASLPTRSMPSLTNGKRIMSGWKLPIALIRSVG
ncbi:hypothetical protein AAF712_014637 [Marasmius tenuissimus]|uniref:Uncharacterized protein n=1 Tax=Marasmius tenuissimus TaxID=585030 RepID=A0ABR2ZAU6_9AGAR